MGRPYKTGSGSLKHHRMGEYWGGLGVSTTVLLYKTSMSGSEFLGILKDQRTKKTVTFIVLSISLSASNLNALTATVLPLHSRFHRSVYPPVARGISSCTLNSSLIRQDLGSLPDILHNVRSTVNAEALRSLGMSAC